MSLNLLFKKIKEKRNFILLNEPLNFNKYCDIIKQNIKHINTYNTENLKIKYDLYLEIFNNINLKTKITNTLLGYGPNSNTSNEYYLNRGWSELETKLLIKNRQGNISIKNISKKRNISIYEAIKVQKEIYNKKYVTTKNKKNYDEIKKSFGNSNRWEFYLNKINPITNNLYTDEEAKEKIYNKQSKGAEAIKRYKVSGERTYIYPTTLQHFLNKGLSLLEAYKALSERQSTFSLEKCIEKYGKQEGYLVWKKRQDKWQQTLNNKSDEEKIEILNKKIKAWKNKFYSKSSIIFFDKLIEICKKDYGIEFEYMYKENEYFIYDQETKKIYFYDFYIKDLDIIIEYNGSHIHPNKEKLSINEWNNWRHLYSKEDAEVIFKKDIYKQNIAINNNKNVLIIWDSDNIFNTIKKITKIIHDEFKNRRKNRRIIRIL